jgi:hypothetical protein
MNSRLFSPYGASNDAAADDWKAIRMPVFPEQRETLHNMVPVWEFHAIYQEPDGEVPKPSSYLAEDGTLDWYLLKRAEFKNRKITEGDREAKGLRWWYYGARHIDPRFTARNMAEEKDAPRPVSDTYGCRERDFEVVMTFRDAILAREGLSTESDPLAIARAFANEILRNWRGGGVRNHPADVLTHRSWCLGAETTTAVILRSLGIPTRGVRCSEHAMCEVFVDGRWYLLDSSQHFINREPVSTPMIPASYMELTTNSTSAAYGPAISDYHRGFFYHWANAHYGMPDGRWEQDTLLHYCPAYAQALYSSGVDYRFKTLDPRRLVILERDIRQLYRSELGIYLNPGESLRESLFIGDLDDVEHFEFILRFAFCNLRHPTPETTRELVLRVGDDVLPLASSATWPATPHWDKTVLISVRLEKSLFQANAVNEIYLENRSRQRIFRIPVVQAVAEPYIEPLRKI